MATYAPMMASQKRKKHIEGEKMKEWFSITLFHYSSKNPIAVIEKLYTSYGRALAAADKYAKRYKCNYIVQQLTHNDMRKFIV